MRSLYMLARQQDLPPEVTQLLSRLLDIALDVRWTWSHSGDSFWRMLDTDVWELTHNPNSILQNLSVNKLRELAVNTEFQRQLDAMDALRNEYLQYESWGDSMRLKERLGCIAYFTMEVGLGAALPLYAGGLGILAGDYLKAARDRGVPVVGVSLLYRQGYFRQVIDSDGWQQEIYAYNDSLNLPVKAVLGKDGSWLRVGVALPGRTVYLRVWQATIGRVTLYLLDSNIGLNSPSDQGITAQLYGGTKEMRLIQEIVLGVGGWRVLDSLGLDVSICHLNEGHAAFVTLERARCFMKKHRLTFPQALWATRASNVFTTHTPVAGAFDKFNRDLLTQYGQPLLEDVGLEVDLEQMWDLGQSPDGRDSEHFNMAYLALRTCAVANGVSQLHGNVSRELFKPLFPHWPSAEIPISHVTNGIHVPSWDSRWADKTWTNACGKERWRTESNNLTQAIVQLSDEEVWALCGKERTALVYHSRTRLRRQFAARGADPERMQRADVVLDPNILTLGMARRFTDYKRNNLLLRDPERLLRLLLNPDHPVQIVVAGKAHPQDTQGKRLLQQWARFVNRPEVDGRAV
ncbi:MAG: alpha-glucan family phosphorylase, partial [Pseudomonadales bacterium]